MPAPRQRSPGLGFDPAAIDDSLGLTERYPRGSCLGETPGLECGREDEATSPRTLNRKGQIGEMSIGTEVEEAVAEGEPRRDFLLLLAGALGGVATAATLVPLIDSLTPAADVIAAGAPIDFDLAQIQPGEQKIVAWRSRPVFVVRRTAAELEDAAATARYEPA